MTIIAHHVLLTSLNGVIFYLQVKRPDLTFHCGALTLVTNILWVWF